MAINSSRGWRVVVGLILACSMFVAVPAVCEKSSDPITLSGHDVLEVVIQFEHPVRSGLGLAKTAVPLVSLEGVGVASLEVDSREVRLMWRWAEGIDAPDSRVMLPELPADTPLRLRWEWNGPEGLLTESVAGYPLRRLGSRFDRIWAVPSECKLERLVRGDDPLGVQIIDARLLSADQAPVIEPDPDLTQHFGHTNHQPIDLEDRRGESIYTCDFQDPSAIADWVVEGPAELILDAGRLVVRSKRPNAQHPEHGHSVLWPPVELPAAYVAEWSFTPINNQGLAIVFFDAVPNRDGLHDILDPRMPARDGTFRHYVASAIDSYHISYFAHAPHNPGRNTSNLRKNAGLVMMGVGDPAVPVSEVDAEPPTVRLRLIRNEQRIQLQADGRVILDITDDDPARFGPPLHGGRLGLRQMQWGVVAYDNLLIEELLPRSKD